MLEDSQLVEVKPNIDQAQIAEGGAIQTVSTLFVSFRVNIHDNQDNYDLIHIGDGSSNYVAVFQDSSGSWGFYDDLSGNETDDPSFILNTWFTLGIKIEFSGSDAAITPRINGVDLAGFVSTGLVINSIQFGGVSTSFLTHVNNHQLDDLNIGTTDWGSSDLFDADFSSTIVPPFDSVTGTGMSISSGTLLVNNVGTNTYATKSFIFPITGFNSSLDWVDVTGVDISSDL